EEKAELNNPLSECANRSGDEAKRDDCGVKPFQSSDVAEQDDKKASSASETAAQKKKKKKTKKSTFEEKKEANTPCDVSVDNNDSESKTMEQGECTKTPLAVVDVHLQDHSPETRRKKKKKKTKKSAFEEKEEAISPCGVNVDNNDSESKTKHGIDEEMLADVNVVKDQSNSPKTGRNKKKKKKGGGFLLSQVSLSEPQNDSDKERNGSGVDEKEAKKTLCDEQITRTKEASDLKKFTGETSLLRLETKERNNLSKVLIITNGLGLDTLRKLFMDIHPSWSNKPDDAKTLDKGRMNLQKHELALFNTGDINKWDVSLVTTVLLFSKECAKELSRNRGYEDAVRTIKDQKNQLISHVSSERMTGDEFNTAWAKISKSLETIGASTKDIEDIHTDDILQGAKFYRDMFLQELAAKDAVQPQIQNIDSTVQDIKENVVKMFNLLSSETSAKCESQPRLIQDFGPAKFYEWQRFCDNVNQFDHHKNNYILITDAMSPANLEHFSVLRSVPWKIVLDLDPSSEEHGMYNDFVSKEGKNSLIDMITPDEIRHRYPSTVHLARHIDPRKTQWLFVNGREKDNLASGGAQAVHDWKCSSLKHITGFLRCCSDPEKLDKHKPVICVILPFLKRSLPFLGFTLERLTENFDEFSLNLVGVKHENIHKNLQTQFDIRLTDLSPSLLSLGLKGLLQVSQGKQYRMPTCQANLPVKLTHNQYLYLQEYLHVLYDGCEELPNVDDEEKLDKIIGDHRESFLSGNWISFLSLCYNHDARRVLTEDVRTHIQRLLDQGPTHSTIVEIHHLPGTGGTTIARRVLWELRKSYPCAIARLKDFKCDIDDDLHFIDALADRIGEVQDVCQVNPLILLDGKHARMEALSNKLVRALNSKGLRAVLLSCLHRPARANDKDTNLDTSDVHAQFFVQVKLEDSSADLSEFELKYKDYINEFKTKTPVGLCRVFHFPLLAMLKGLEGFGSKLKNIVHESFDGMDGLQKEIAAVVAFIQQYAAQETPASLLYKAFKKYVRKSDIEQERQGITYKEISQLITDQLLSLMVPARPTRYPRRASTSSVSPETYTLQHPLVADMVLKRYYTTQKCDVLTLTRRILEFPIFRDDQFFSLINDLFIRKRSFLPKARFTTIFEELKSLDPRAAGEVFCELAEKTSDAIVFAHAARFYAKQHPPSFPVATELIAKAFGCKNAQSRSRIIYDMKGQILHGQLRFLIDKHKIDAISTLEDIADGAIRSFKSARNWPPTYASPLMGEVKVWISCIEWITKNECNCDTDEAFEFITSTAPPFFHTCIGDSLHLLDVVDTIVQKEANLPEPEETQKQANTLRLSLLSTFNKGKAPGRREKDISRACAALCSPDKFPKCSQVELKCLQVYYILSSVDQQIEVLKREHVEFLLKLLEDLVFTNTQGRGGYMARHLMKVSLLVTGPKQYSLGKGLRIADMWIQESVYDPLPYFYQMMIYFLNIIDGNQVSDRDNYNKALDKCREKSQNHCRGTMSTHFLKKTGDGMNRLMTRSALLNGEPEYPSNVKEFWPTHSRKKLLECSGRIRIRSKSGKRKQVYIDLVKGNIELYVGKTADIGKVERDYSQGTMVYFVISFNLHGPVANGITFKPKDNPPKSYSTK
ncbi:hypothetical protein QZH41_014999, partial [Actinostola sp. cb2023]